MKFRVCAVVSVLLLIGSVLSFILGALPKINEVSATQKELESLRDQLQSTEADADRYSELRELNLELCDYDINQLAVAGESISNWVAAVFNGESESAAFPYHDEWDFEKSIEVFPTISGNYSALVRWHYGTVQQCTYVVFSLDSAGDAEVIEAHTTFG